MTAESELWACRVCRSINSRRSNRCYSCHTPREAAEVNPADIPTVGSLPPIEQTYTFRSSEPRAVLATMLTAIFIMASLLTTFLLWQAAALRVAGERAESDSLYGTVVLFLPVLPIVAAFALLAYAAWISRVVGNLPALGLGYSRVSSTMAFIEPLIPGFNLYALPARVGEVLRKLDEKGSGLPLLGLAWILFIAPVAVVAVAVRLSGSRFDRLLGRAPTLFEAGNVHTITFTIFIGSVFQAMALLIGLYLVWQVERQARTLAEARAKDPAARAKD